MASRRVEQLKQKMLAAQAIQEEETDTALKLQKEATEKQAHMESMVDEGMPVSVAEQDYHVKKEVEGLEKPGSIFFFGKSREEQTKFITEGSKKLIEASLPSQEKFETLKHLFVPTPTESANTLVEAHEAAPFPSLVGLMIGASRQKRKMATVGAMADLMYMGWLGKVGTSLAAKIPKFWKTKRLEKPEEVINESEQIEKIVKTQGENVDLKKPHEFIVERNYDVDPELTRNFRNANAVKREKQLEGLEEEDLGQVMFNDYAKANPGRIDPEMKQMLITNQITAEQVRAVQPVTQLADESMFVLDAIKDPAKRVMDDEWSGILLKKDKIKAIWQRAVTTSLTALDNTGTVTGKVLVKKFKDYVDIPEVKTATALTKMEPHIAGLSKKEWENYVDVLDDQFYKTPNNPNLFKLFEDIKPMNAKVKAAVEATALETGKVTDEARLMGLDVAQVSRPFWTHQLINDKKLLGKKGNKYDEELLDYLVKTGQAGSKGDAKNLMNAYHSKRADRKFKGLEKERTIHIKGYANLKKFGFGVDKKWDRVARRHASPWDNYFLGSTRRIEEVVQFGKKGELLSPNVTKLGVEGFENEADIAERLYFRLTNRNEIDNLLLQTTRHAINPTVIAMMGLSQIMQLGSIPNIFIKFGFQKGMVGSYKGFKSLFRNNDRRFAEQTGAIFQNTLNDLREVHKTNKFTDAYLKAIGMTKTDELTRLMAVHAGKFHLIDVAKRLKTKPSPKLKAQLAKDLTFSEKQIDELFVSPKRIDFENPTVRLAIKRLSDGTVGRVRATELPLWLSSPYASVVTLFKNYLIWHTKFMKDNVWKKPSNWAPALLYSLPMGEAVGNIRSVMSGRERPEGIDRILDDLMFVQAFGIVGDLFMAARYGEKRLMSFLAGAPLSHLVQWGHAVFESFEDLMDGRKKRDDHKKLMKKASQQVIRAIPYVGPRIHTELMDNLDPQARVKEPFTRR